MSAFDEIWQRPSVSKAERVAELLARSPLFQPEAAMSEQEQAERIVAGRERQRQHDAYFADEFISPGEQHVISRTLAKRLGFHVGDDRVTGDIDRDEQRSFGDDD